MSSRAFRRVLFAAAASAGTLAAAPALAHGFGQRFDLPLPLSFWVAGAGASIVLSFEVMAIFVRERPVEGTSPRLNLLRFGFFRALAHPIVVGVIRAVAVVVFLATIVGGFIGDQDAYSNIIVPMIWVIWWVGVAFVCAMVGNLWALINPLRTIFLALETAWGWISGGRPLSLGLHYPSRLGAWPAVVLFLAFAWAELVWNSSDVPNELARAVLIYSLISWAGMFLFGREVWLRNGEAFSIAFGILARFAPIDANTAEDGQTRRLDLRPFGAGLMNYAGVTASLLVFVLVMLSTVTFDGFIETPGYRNISRDVFGTPWSANLLFDIAEWTGISEREVLLATILILFPLIFVVVFFAGSWIMVQVTRRWGGPSKASEVTTGRAALAFVLTLVPIAVAYHLAHYFTYLVTQSAYVLAPLSDPFARGWNLFGTAAFEPGMGTMSPSVYWYLAVTVIIVGHVIAVYLAHIVALRLFQSRKAALVSQIPMVVLMVLYTMVSLLILAQPIVDG